MEKLVIKGGKPLSGEVTTSGSKNASLPLMVASLLTDGDVVLRNVPDLLDIRVLIELLERLGKKISFKNNTVRISQTGKLLSEAPYELVSKMRASIIVLGPLLARNKKCRVALPGGCAFGPRPVDLHIKGMESLGATISIDHGYIDARADELLGQNIDLLGKFGSSVLGTDNVMMAATLARGTTVINGAAKEPECADLANMLIEMGAKITGLGSSEITIEGVEELKGVEYTVIPDRLEAVTFLAGALVTGGGIKVTGCNPSHFEKPLEILKEIGAEISRGDDFVEISSRGGLKPFSIDTAPYPGFPTDLQPIFVALACLIKGKSQISEGIYTDRFGYTLELNRMGASIAVEGSAAIVSGGINMSGAEVKAPDIRAGAALVVAALAASNTTTISDIHYIDRGHEKIEEKLRSIGTEIERVD